jgi:hypothetical protein
LSYRALRSWTKLNWSALRYSYSITQSPCLILTILEQVFVLLGSEDLVELALNDVLGLLQRVFVLVSGHLICQLPVKLIQLLVFLLEKSNLSLEVLNVASFKDDLLRGKVTDLIPPV